MKLSTSDINSINNSIYMFGSNAKISNELATEFQSNTGNNVNVGDLCLPITLNRIKTAINKLESKFSSNCCQFNCNSTSTKCQYTTCQGQCSCQSFSTSCQTQCK
jgi:hypothetical protein